MSPPHLLSQLSPYARCMTLGCFHERQRTTPVTCMICKHLMAQHQWGFAMTKRRHTVPSPSSCVSVMV